MPKPELFIIFTGNRGRKPDTISLSQEFFDGAEIDVEVKAKVIYESDTEDIINQYIIFCKVFDEQRKLYGMTEQTVKETICICKDRDILKQYLSSREVEVVTIMMSLFDKEQIIKTYLKDAANAAAAEAAEAAAAAAAEAAAVAAAEAAEAAAAAASDAARETARETAERLIKKGKMTLEDIADCVPSLSFDELKEIEAEVMQMA